VFENFEVKRMFEDQIHERHQFTLNIQGDNYQGVFHDGEITWFHPHPEKKLEDDHLEAVESKVYELMTDDSTEHLRERY
jgi:hypothetical protein